MRISPLDIRKQTFKGKMRGADPEEVRIFLDVVASEYEQILQENAMLAERLRSHEARLSEYTKLEENMRSSLVTVERIANESRESSEREARRLVQDAHMRAERILEDARERLQILVREIEMLRGKKEVFARRFWTLIEGQIAILQEHMTDMVEVDSLRQTVSRMAGDAQDAHASEPMPPRTEPQPVESRPAAPRSSDAYAAAPRPGDAWAPAPMEAGPAPERPAPAGTWIRPPAARRPEPAPVAVPAKAHEAESEPSDGEPSARRNVPKGLRSLLRGRQAQLPLEDPNPPATAEPEPTGESAFASLERREGFFELRAGETQRDDASKRFRSSGLDRP